jgi:WD40 repeat protein
VESGELKDKSMQGGICGACWVGGSKSNIVIGSDDGGVTILTCNLENSNTSIAHDDIVSAVACDLIDTSKFISCGLDGECVRWDVSEAAPHLIGRHRAHKGAINDVAFCSTSPTYCTVGFDRVARVWDVRCASDPVTALGLPQTPSVCEWAGQEAHAIICGFEDGALCRIDTRKPDVLLPASFRHDGRVTSLLRRGDSLSGMLSASQDRWVVMWVYGSCRVVIYSLFMSVSELIQRAALYFKINVLPSRGLLSGALFRHMWIQQVCPE